MCLNSQGTRPRAASEKKGGRKDCFASMPALEENFWVVVQDYKAGDPMQENVIWTYLTPGEIAEELTEQGTPVCEDTARKILDHFKFVKRKSQKKKALGKSPHRNEQFENIARLKKQYLDSPNPILSMDTKKKEMLGEFCRGGTLFTTGVLEGLDHDFLTSASGLIIPHGLYDLKRNAGHITLGFSHDTSEFACDSLNLWWRRHGQLLYPKADSILLLCDGGGSNNAKHYIFKEDLQRLVNKIRIPIRVAHYPPYCSKYNPIEHRFFPHVTRAIQGVFLTAVEFVKKLIKRTHTSTGLRATVGTLTKYYAIQRQASDRFLESYPIVFDDLLPTWNYTVVPSTY